MSGIILIFVIIILKNSLKNTFLVMI